MLIKWGREEHLAVHGGKAILCVVGLLNFWKEELALFLLYIFERGAVDVFVSLFPKEGAEVP